jgi:non-ribosomal peptide synthetase component E (peptide arylation enzyme)
MRGDTIPNIKAVLKKASQIAIRQHEHQGYWSDHTLLDIASVQRRAGDFDGALHTITKSNYPYGRMAALDDLAKTMARAGRRKQAFTVLRQMGTDHGWRQDLLHDRVTMAYLEHQISSGDLKGAHQSIN